MNWILFTGTWRLTNVEVEADVRSAVRDVVGRGDGVLTGGATGVDYFAMDEALKLKPDGSHLKIIIPAHLKDYIIDYHIHWCKKPITTKDIDAVSSLLTSFKVLQPNNLIEMPYRTITQTEYLLRDTEEVIRSHEVYAFQVNNSIGTQDTIDKAREAGLLITLHKTYQIAE